MTGGSTVRIDVFTIFPDLIRPWTEASLIGKAARSGLLDLRVHDLRAGTSDPHRSVDDSPFGGGAGMVLAPEPVFAAVEAADPPRPLLLLGPGGPALRPGLGGGAGRRPAGSRCSAGATRASTSGSPTTWSTASSRSATSSWPAVRRPPSAVIEVVARLVPGVMGNEESAHEESFGDGLLEYPQYTRPQDFRGWPVPDVLRSGDHARVARWRRAQALARTQARRPDLIAARGGLAEEERALLAEFGLDALS